MNNSNGMPCLKAKITTFDQDTCEVSITGDNYLYLNTDKLMELLNDSNAMSRSVHDGRGAHNDPTCWNDVTVDNFEEATWVGQRELNEAVAEMLEQMAADLRNTTIPHNENSK